MEKKRLRIGDSECNCRSIIQSDATYPSNQSMMKINYIGDKKDGISVVSLTDQSVPSDVLDGNNSDTVDIVCHELRIKQEFMPIKQEFNAPDEEVNEYNLIDELTDVKKEYATDGCEANSTYPSNQSLMKIKEDICDKIDGISVVPLTNPSVPSDVLNGNISDTVDVIYHGLRIKQEFMPIKQEFSASDDEVYEYNLTDEHTDVNKEYVNDCCEEDCETSELQILNVFSLSERNFQELKNENNADNLCLSDVDFLSPPKAYHGCACLNDALEFGYEPLADRPSKFLKTEIKEEHNTFPANRYDPINKQLKDVKPNKFSTNKNAVIKGVKRKNC